MLNKTFISLMNEAAFAYELLGSGVTQIRKANYSNKGIYYQSFINLTVGIERVSKICILLDYYINNEGSFPNEKFLRKIGHDLVKLNTILLNIKDKYNFKFDFLNSLDGEIHQNIIKILSDFAINDRYENLNNLVNEKENNNPLNLWQDNVDLKIYDKIITQKKKEKIINNARQVHQMMNQFTSTSFIAEDKSEITNVFEGSLRTGIYKEVSPYRQLYVAQIIRFYSELLRELQYKAMQLGKDEIPFFNEGFGCFYNSDSYLKTRKNYEL